MGFIDEIKAKAKSNIKTIVLPETEDARTYEAAEKILKEGTSAGFGVRYNNVGEYTNANGRPTPVDMKMTITDYKLMDGHSPKLGAVAFDVGKNSDADGNGSILCYSLSA